MGIQVQHLDGAACPLLPIVGRLSSASRIGSSVDRGNTLFVETRPASAANSRKTGQSANISVIQGDGDVACKLPFVHQD